MLDGWPPLGRVVDVVDGRVVAVVVGVVPAMVVVDGAVVTGGGEAVVVVDADVVTGTVVVVERGGALVPVVSGGLLVVDTGADVAAGEPALGSTSQASSMKNASP